MAESYVRYIDACQPQAIPPSSKLLARIMLAYSSGVTLAFIFVAIPLGPVESVQNSFWIYSFANQQWFGIVVYFSLLWCEAWAIPARLLPSVAVTLPICMALNACTSILLLYTNATGNIFNKMFPPFMVTVPIFFIYTLWTCKTLRSLYRQRTNTEDGPSADLSIQLISQGPSAETDTGDSDIAPKTVTRVVGHYITRQKPRAASEYSAAFIDLTPEEGQRSDCFDTQYPPLYLYRNPMLQQFLACLYWCVILCTYTFCEEMTLQFTIRNDATLNTRFVGLVLIFIAALYGFKWSLKGIGFAIDMGKLGSSPFYFQGEVVVLTYYYLFHRIIFTTVKSPYEFALLQGLHIAFEWFMYPFRATDWYYHRSMMVSNRMTFLPKKLRGFLSQTNVTCIQWRAFLCLDYGVRLFMMLTVTIAYTLFSIFLRFSYNALHYQTFNSFYMSDEQFRLNMIFLGCALCSDIISLTCMQVLYWRRCRLSVLQRVGCLMYNRRFLLFTATLVGAITINAFVARIGSCLYETAVPMDGLYTACNQTVSS